VKVSRRKTFCKNTSVWGSLVEVPSLATTLALVEGGDSSSSTVCRRVPYVVVVRQLFVLCHTVQLLYTVW
jgi:hypothetical protein